MKQETFSVIGGITLPVLTITFNCILETILLAAIGATTGLLVNWIFKKITDKLKRK